MSDLHPGQSIGHSVWVCTTCGCEYVSDVGTCGQLQPPCDGIVARFPDVPDEVVDAAVRAFNDWPATHPMDELSRMDRSWQAMRRALLAAADPESFARYDTYRRRAARAEAC